MTLEADRKNYRDNAKRKVFEIKQTASNISYRSALELSRYIYELPNLVKELIRILKNYLQPKRLGSSFDEMINQINSRISPVPTVVLTPHNINLLSGIDPDSEDIVSTFSSFTAFTSVQGLLTELSHYKTLVNSLSYHSDEISTHFSECLLSIRGAAIGVFLVCDDAHEYYRNSLSIDSVIVGVRVFFNAIRNLLTIAGVL